MRTIPYWFKKQLTVKTPAIKTGDILAVLRRSVWSDGVSSAARLGNYLWNCQEQADLWSRSVEIVYGIIRGRRACQFASARRSVPAWRILTAEKLLCGVRVRIWVSNGIIELRLPRLPRLNLLGVGPDLRDSADNLFYLTLRYSRI